MIGIEGRIRHVYSSSKAGDPLPAIEILAGRKRVSRFSLGKSRFVGEGSHGDASDRFMVNQCTPVEFLPLFLVTGRSDDGCLNIHGRMTVGVDGMRRSLHGPSLRQLSAERHI